MQDKKKQNLVLIQGDVPQNLEYKKTITGSEDLINL